MRILKNHRFMTKEQLIEKYKGRVKVHPSDKRALVIYGITEKEHRDICKQCHCSGMMANDNVGVVLNFGMYK